MPVWSIPLLIKALQDLLRKSIHREYYDQHEGSFAGAPPRVIEGHLGELAEPL